MAAGVEIEQDKLQELHLKDIKIMADWSKTYVLTQSCVEQLFPAVKQCLFHASNSCEHLQLRPEATIILQIYVTLAM